MSWDVLQRCSRVGNLTSSEQAVADFYTSALPGAAFMNLHQVSSASGVSTASVTRFARKLGFTDFRAMAASLQSDARAVLERPGDRMNNDSRPAMSADRIRRAQADLEATSQVVDPHEIQRAIALLSDVSRPVLLGAVASGRPLLDHAGLLLSYVRGDVQVLGGTDRWPHVLAGISTRHVILAAAYDRDPLPVLHLLERARGAGASSIAITNVSASPLLTMADVPLRICAAPGTPFGSRVPLLAVLEILIDGVAATPAEGRSRADAIEQSFDALGIHPATSSGRSEN